MRQAQPYPLSKVVSTLGVTAKIHVGLNIFGILFVEAQIYVGHEKLDAGELFVLNFLDIIELFLGIELFETSEN